MTATAAPNRTLRVVQPDEAFDAATDETIDDSFDETPEVDLLFTYVRQIGEIGRAHV